MNKKSIKTENKSCLKNHWGSLMTRLCRIRLKTPQIRTNEEKQRGLRILVPPI